MQTHDKFIAESPYLKAEFVRTSCDESRTQLWVTDSVSHWKGFDWGSEQLHRFRPSTPPTRPGDWDRNLGIWVIDHIIIIMGVCCVLWIIQTRTSSFITGPCWHLNLLRASLLRCLGCWSSTSFFLVKTCIFLEQALEAPPRLWRKASEDRNFLLVYVR